MIHATTDKDRERPGKLPKFFFYVASQYLYKLKMGAYKDAEIIDTNELTYHSRIYALSRRLTEFPVILMSTGLASHLNGYSTIAKHLASKGIIVFCMA
jgi:predicted dienelactone hydrolase